MIYGVIIALLISVIIIIDNLLTQIKQLENHIEEITDKDDRIEEDVEKYYKYFLEIFTEAYNQMKRVDKRGAFSSDDEVGFSFKVLLKSIEDVSNKLKNMRTNPEEEKTPER